jgi:hypothetical protein
VQMASMQRTRQLPLEPDVAARIQAAGTSASHATKTAYEAPPPSAEQPEARAPVRTEIAEPADLRPGVETTKWSPPSNFEARLAAGPPSGVDRTMDDQQLSTRTAPVASTVRTSPPQPRSPAHSSHPSFDGTSSAPAQRGRSEMPTMPGAGEARPIRGHTRALVLVVLCFLVGAVGMGAVAYRAGLLGGARAHAAQRDAALARANEALSHQRWDVPPGDNVRDITTEALVRWPGDADLLRVRSLASEKIASAANARFEQGDAAEARRLLGLAQQLDASAEGVKKLIAELAAKDEKPAETSVPPLASARSSIGAASPSNGVRAQLDASNAKPGPGQPVDFLARIVGAATGARARVDGAVFRVSGPGVATGTQLDASDDGSGVFRTTFTFLQAGRFEVGFAARADGAPVRATRVVVVGQPKTPPPAASAAGDGPSAPATPAAPSSSVKWL